MNPDDDTDSDLAGTITNIGDTIAGGIVAVKDAEKSVKDAYSGADKVATDNASKGSGSNQALFTGIAIIGAIIGIVYLMR